LAQVKRDLVAKEVEIDPGVRAASLPASENATVEAARGFKIGHMVGEMKQGAHSTYP
jgi:hypothetical protein